MDEERGVIRNRQYANQVRNFSGLRFGNITPTDFDMVIEYHNICYVYGEFKFENVSLPYGQRLALERQCDDMQKVKPAIAIIASHSTPPGEDIDAANTTVTEYRFRGAWHETTTPTTTFELVDRFLKWAEMDTHRK